MKFGKNLLCAMDLSDPAWKPYWLDYKQLKKLIKIMSDEKNSQDWRKPKESPLTAAQLIAQSPLEKDFFALLTQEMQKVTNFFIQAEQSIAQWKDSFNTKLDAAKSQLEGGIPVEKETDYGQFLSECVKIYKRLLLLENFAILNYCGFSKILKKHDRWTGFVTREKFMVKKISRLPFSHYPRLTEMVQTTEQTFQSLMEMGDGEKLKRMRLNTEDAKSLSRIQKLHATSSSQQKQVNGNDANEESEDEENNGQNKRRKTQNGGVASTVTLQGTV